MTRSEEYMMMKILRAQGWSIKDIAAELNCDRKTVRKWLNSNELPQYKRNTKPLSKLDSFKDYIVKRMNEGCFNAVVIFDEIVDMGYLGKMTILRDFMRTHREPARAKASIRFETPPGKQAQVDWGEVAAVDLGDQIHKFYAFVMIMGHSRYEYVEFTENMKLDTLIGCHERAFKFFGGIPETIVYDNMRTVVNRGKKSGNEKWNKKFFHFALHHGFTLHRCRPYLPRSKGKVENGVKYVKQNFWPRVRTITGLADLNRQTLQWLDQTCNVRIHQTTREQPKSAF